MPEETLARMIRAYDGEPDALQHYLDDHAFIEAELIRLRRIEEEARAFVRECDPADGYDVFPLDTFLELAGALGTDVATNPEAK
jgi:hypothetical protein